MGKLPYSGAELRLDRRTLSSYEVYWRVRELRRAGGGVAWSDEGGVLTSSEDDAEEERDWFERVGYEDGGRDRGRW